MDSAFHLADLTKLSPGQIVIRDEAENRFIRFETPEAFFEFYENLIDQNGTPKRPLHYHEVLRENSIQKMRFDIDIKYSDLEFDDPSMEIIDYLIKTTIAVFETDYPHHIAIDRDSFIICNSSGPIGDEYKSSYHIISPLYGNISWIKEFSTIVFDKLRIDHAEWEKYVDSNVYKSKQNFRLPYSSKIGQTERYKKVPADINWRESLLGFYPTLAQPDAYPDILLRAKSSKQSGTSNFLTNIIVEHPIQHEVVMQLLRAYDAEFDNTWQFRNENNGIFYFRRLQSSHCPLCDRQHDKDNTLYVTIAPSGSRPVYWRCFHAPKSAKPIIIGHLNGENSLLSLATMAMIDESINTPVIMVEDTQVLNKRLENNLLLEEYNEPQIRDFPICDNLFIKANMKMGKTKAFMKYLDRKSEHHIQTVVFLSFRQTFSSSIATNLRDHEFVSYQSIEERKIYLSINQRVIIQIESLMRLCLDCDCDLLVLDESESILSQFSSPNITDLNLIYAIFQNLLRKAKRVISMDANLGPRTTNIIMKERQFYMDTRLSTNIISVNTYQNAVDDKYFLFTTIDDFHEKIVKTIQDNKKIVLCTNTLSEAKRVIELLHKVFDPTRDVVVTTHTNSNSNSNSNLLRIALYSSDTSPSIKQRHFADVHTYWSQVDVLIYTPTVTAGISFELEYFDVLFGMFTDSSCDVETCRQMMGRVRNLRDKTHYLYLHSSGKQYPTDRDAIEMIVEKCELALYPFNYQKSPVLIDLTDIDFASGEISRSVKRSPPFDVIVENIIHDNISRSKFVRRMIQQLKYTGARLTRIEPFIEKTIVVPSNTELQKEQRQRYGREISEATEITTERYQEILHAKFQQIGKTIQEILPSEMRSFTKHGLILAYDARNEDIIPEFVLTFDNKSLRDAYWTLKHYDNTIEWVGHKSSADIEEIRISVESRDFMMRLTHAHRLLDIFEIDRIRLVKHTWEIADFRNLLENIYTNNLDIVILRHFYGYDSRASLEKICQHILLATFGLVLRITKKYAYIHVHPQLYAWIMHRSRWLSVFPEIQRIIQ